MLTILPVFPTTTPTYQATPHFHLLSETNNVKYGKARKHSQTLPTANGKLAQIYMFSHTY